MTKCLATTKKGTACKFDAVPGCDGLCTIHFDSKIENEIKAKNKSNPLCKVKGCRDHSFNDTDGYCAKHWFEFGFTATSSIPTQPPPPRPAAAAVPDSAIINAFRELEMEPTHACEAVRAKFHEMVKRPDIRIAFTNVEITPETESARAKFVKLKAAFDFLKSIGRA